MATQHVKIKAKYAACDDCWHIDEEGEMAVSEPGIAEYFAKTEHGPIITNVIMMEKPEDDMYGVGYAFIARCDGGDVLIGELLTDFFSETTGYHPPFNPDGYFMKSRDEADKMPTCECASCKATPYRDTAIA